MRLKEKVAIVTGGARGIGRAYALGLAVEGARIAVADIDFPAASQVAEEIIGKGGEALALATDVADEKSAMEMAQKVVERFGRIDILINNAAFYHGLTYKPFDEIGLEEWDKVMAVNLRGLFLCTRAVAPYMKSQRSGKIINISSGTVWFGQANRIHYTTSKAGVVGFTRCLARELGDYNINVNCVAPGLTETEAARASQPKEGLDRIVSMRCLKRREFPEDLVGTVIFLSSPDSDFITGQTIVVDGGRSMN